VRVAAVDDLDDLYGPAIAAQNGGLRSWEADQQLICYALDQPAARELSALISAASAGNIGFRVASSVTLIWVVSLTGTVIFALEETIDLNGTSRRPRMRGMPLNSSVKPLGHPLLVGGEPARIAGELYLDRSGDGALTWVLTNRSGRYGIHRSRTGAQLANVAEVFRSYQLPVVTDFIAIG
jgi:hypothetical protein